MSFDSRLNLVQPAVTPVCMQVPGVERTLAYISGSQMAGLASIIENASS